MFSEDLQIHLEKSNNLISEDSCTGYPYLSLTKNDYNLKNTDSSYKSYLTLIKKYGYLDNWDNGKASLFDIHPIFSNAKLIPGLMGLHLSLILLEKEIAGTSQTLYFDTAANWLKFTKISDKRYYAVATWMRFNYESLTDSVENDKFEDEDEESDNNPFLYVKSSVFLIKGNELANVHLKAPSNYNKKILDYYKAKPHLLKKQIDLRSILEKETQEYLEFISDALKDQPILRESAAYLFMLILCREFGIESTTFHNVKTEHNYKFDFASDADILKYTDFALMYVDALRIKIGEYSEPDLSCLQTDIDLYKPSSEKDNQDAEDSDRDQSNSDEEDFNLQTAELVESIKNQSVEAVRKFYEMKPALTGDDIQKKLYGQWRNLAFCFLYPKLDQEMYNKLRSVMDSFVKSEMKKNNLAEFKNYDIQMNAIDVAAFNIFQSSTFEYFNLYSIHYSEVAINLFSKLKMPELTKEQQIVLNTLNSSSKEKFIEKINHNLCQKLDNLLQLSIGKIAHPNYQNQLGDVLSNIDHELLKQMVISWYVDSYVSQYINIDSSYDSVFSMIENDFIGFTKNELINQSILKEVRSFVRVKYNPRDILDFNSNY